MSDEVCCGKCDTTGLNRLEYEIKVALDRVDGDPAGLNEETARYLAQQANLYRAALRRRATNLASRETVNG